MQTIDLTAILNSAYTTTAKAFNAIGDLENKIQGQTGTVWQAICTHHAAALAHGKEQGLVDATSINKAFYTGAEKAHNTLQAKLLAKNSQHAFVEFKSDSLRTMNKLYWFAVNNGVPVDDYGAVKVAYKNKPKSEPVKNPANPPSNADNSAAAIAAANGFTQPTISQSTVVEVVPAIVSLTDTIKQQLDNLSVEELADIQGYIASLLLERNIAA